MHDGKRLLSTTVIAQLNEPLSIGWDNVLRMQITYGRGVTLREVSPVRFARVCIQKMCHVISVIVRS